MSVPDHEVGVKAGGGGTIEGKWPMAGFQKFLLYSLWRTARKAAASLIPAGPSQWRVSSVSSLPRGQSKKGEPRRLLATTAEKKGKVRWEVTIETAVKERVFSYWRAEGIQDGYHTCQPNIFKDFITSFSKRAHKNGVQPCSLWSFNSYPFFLYFL